MRDSNKEFKVKKTNDEDNSNEFHESLCASSQYYSYRDIISEGIKTYLPLYNYHGTAEFIIKIQVFFLLIAGFIIFLPLSCSKTYGLYLYVIFSQSLYSILLAYKFYLFYLGKKYISFSKNSSNFVKYHQTKDNLPPYTIILPLLKEANIVAQLIDNIKLIAYPANKLQVLIVLEMNDIETISSVRNQIIPNHFHIIIVPRFLPYTKAKACNYALQYVTGKYLVIYDSEDQPSPDQLLKTAAIFEKRTNVGAIQAVLNYYNSEDNLLTKMFSFEYTMLFQYSLKGLELLDMSIPLGGSSSHLRFDMLRKLKGWDIYNVTEDAELGMRMSKFNYKTHIIFSETLEESPIFLWQWLKQRSRWIKGHLKTFAIHGFLNQKEKHPEQTKIQSFKVILSTYIMLGLPYIAMISVPISFYCGIFLYFNKNYHNNIYYLNNICIIFSCITLCSYLLITLWQTQAIAKKSDSFLAKIIYPMYSLLQVFAAYMALYDLFLRPFHWQKTKHGFYNKKKSNNQKQIL